MATFPSSDWSWHFVYYHRVLACYRPALGMNLRKVSYEAFVFSLFLGNQEQTRPLTRKSVSSEALQLCQREIATDEIQEEEENYREHSNIKRSMSVH